MLRLEFVKTNFQNYMDFNDYFSCIYSRTIKEKGIQND